MEVLGYEINNVFSINIDYNRKRFFKIDKLHHPNYLIDNYFYDFAIVKEQELYVGYNYKKEIKLVDETLERLKLKILKYWIKETKC